MDDLTHIHYAFADLNPDTGEVFLSNLEGDTEIHYPADPVNEAGHNLYGNLGALYNLKKAHRHLKVLISIGGWEFSPKFHPVVVSPERRKKFVESSVTLLEDCGWDGIDVDYEFPSTDQQVRGFVSLLKELRTALDQHARDKDASYKFLLTIAAPCGPDNYSILPIEQMDQWLDYWCLMAYDFAGKWSTVTGHHANLYGQSLSASKSVCYYISHGVARSKVILGIPLYGRSFANTDGLGKRFAKEGEGSWELGVYDYRALPLPGSQVTLDEQAGASWSYDPQTRELVSFDSEEVARWKGQYIKREGLGGCMFWELSLDKGSDRGPDMETGPGKDPQPGSSLVTIVKSEMGNCLRKEVNWLKYEGSQFDNMKNGMLEMQPCNTLTADPTFSIEEP